MGRSFLGSILQIWVVGPAMSVDIFFLFEIFAELLIGKGLCDIFECEENMLAHSGPVSADVRCEAANCNYSLYYSSSYTGSLCRMQFQLATIRLYIAAELCET